MPESKKKNLIREDNNCKQAHLKLNEYVKYKKKLYANF